MAFNKLIRTLVVWTNRIPPFTRLNRIPYAIAIKKIVRLAASLPGIKSLYLRHGLTRSDWEPGLSDIDFSVILSRELSQAEEFELVQRFMASYESLQRWIPILGEMDIVSETCCNAWSRFSIRGAEVSQWKLLYGADIVTTHYVDNDLRLRKDSLDYACWVYEGHVLRRFLTSDSSRWIDLQVMARVARKALRYAGGKSEIAADAHLPSQIDPAVVVLHVLQYLDTQVKSVLQQSCSGSPASDRFLQVLDTADKPGYSATRFAELRKYDSIIDTIVVSYSTSFIVLKDNISLMSLVGELNGIGHICRTQKIQPIVVTHSLFQYLLWSYRPQVFLELREHSHSLSGTDLLSELVRPSSQNLASELLNQSLNTMLTPANYANSCRDSARHREWVSQAWRSAFIRLYLDTGLIGSHARSVEACRENYPQLCEEIDQFSESRGTSEESSRAFHALLLRYALEINSRIEALDPENLPVAEVLTW